MKTKYEYQCNWDLKVIFISNATEEQKDYVLDKYDRKKYYRVSKYIYDKDCPYFTYKYEPVLILDNFCGQLSILQMNRVLDTFPLPLWDAFLPNACYDTIIIFSDNRLESLYTSIKRSNPEIWRIFLSRIAEVHHHNNDGTIEEYSSVKDYFNNLLDSACTDNHSEVIETLNAEEKTLPLYDLISVNEAAQILQVSDSYIYSQLKIDPLFPGGRLDNMLVVDRSRIMAWYENKFPRKSFELPEEVVNE